MRFLFAGWFSATADGKSNLCRPYSKQGFLTCPLLGATLGRVAQINFRFGCGADIPVCRFWGLSSPRIPRQTISFGRRSWKTSQPAGSKARPTFGQHALKVHPTVVYLCAADTVCFWDIKKNVKPSKTSRLSGIFELVCTMLGIGRAENRSFQPVAPPV
jgi:hypothetical protein